VRREWWKNAVIYQVYPRSYGDSDGDGIGDLQGIRQRLDHLQWLGVDAVWLSPFYPSPMKDFGYDISDYRNVHPLFGSLQDFDDLIADLHARDMRLLIDYVPNHSSDQHPWFLESRSGRDHPRREWYVWRDPKPDGSLPNNWLSVFGGPAWTLDEHTGQFYLHSFLPEQPDLNWRHPEVKAAMFDVVRFWLSRGVDGLRIDTAHYILKDPDLRDNPPATGGVAFHRPMGEYDRQLHLYDKGHPDAHAVYRELRGVLDAFDPVRQAVSIGEIHVFDWHEWATYYGEALDELHMPFNFGLLTVPWDALAIRQVVNAVEAALPSGAWPNQVLGNHDESRVASRAGPLQTRVAMLLLLTLRGTPTLYQGDELGLEDVPIPAGREQDPWGLQVPGMSRDPVRAPIPWQDVPNGGFCPPNVESWLPLPADLAHLSVEAQRRNEGSMLHFTRRLLALRRLTPALREGTYRPLDTPEGTFAYLREFEGESVLTALNFTGQQRQLALGNLPTGTVLLSTHGEREAVDLTKFTLRPDEGCVLVLRGG